MVLSLMTSAIAIVNSAGFVLLSPSAELGDYIACSAIFSVATWIFLWVLPAGWGYDLARWKPMRQAQVHTVAIASAAIAATSPSVVGALFVGMLVVEAWFFYQFLLLFESRTDLFQRISFGRAIGQSIGLLVTVVFFQGGAVAYGCALLLVAIATGIAGRLASERRAPDMPFRSVFRFDYLDNLEVIFRSPSLKALLAARGVELSFLALMNQWGRLGSIVCLKAGLVCASALSTNARQYRDNLLLLACSVLYMVGLGGAALVNAVTAGRAPGALASVRYLDVAIALPAVLVFQVLLVRSLKASDTSPR